MPAPLRRWLLGQGLAAEEELSEIESAAQEAVDASVEFARQGRHPDPEAGVLNTQAEGAVVATQFYNRRNIVTT